MTTENHSHMEKKVNEKKKMLVDYFLLKKILHHRFQVSLESLKFHDNAQLTMVTIVRIHRKIISHAGKKKAQ